MSYYVMEPIGGPFDTRDEALEWRGHLPEAYAKRVIVIEETRGSESAERIQLRGERVRREMLQGRRAHGA